MAKIVNLVNLESLKIFCDVVREKSFSRGASLNRVSQSAASQAVLQLEKRLGLPLIDRSKRPLALTDEGRVYYDECRQIVDRYLALEARIQSRHTDAVGRVNVASIYSVVLYDMNKYVQRFTAQHPQYQVRFKYVHPDEVYDSILSGQADLGLISFPRSRREIEIIPWRNEPMVLVCSPGHRFAAQKQLTPDQLDGADFVAFESSLAIRRHMDRFLREHKVAANVVMAFDNIEFIKRALETNVAVSILPEPTVRHEVNSGALRVVPMAGLDLVRPLCIIRRRKPEMTPAVQSFIKILKELGGDLKGPRRSLDRKLNERIKE
jgi:DNA-binding transcriptional LysR family regulator